VKELQSLGKSLSSGGSSYRAPPIPNDVPTDNEPRGPEDGYYYPVKAGDTIALIAKAYRDKGIKVTSQQILDANPGLKPTSLKVDQKIFIPKPKQ